MEADTDNRCNDWKYERKISCNILLRALLVYASERVPVLLETNVAKSRDGLGTNRTSVTTGQSRRLKRHGTSIALLQLCLCILSVVMFVLQLMLTHSSSCV